MTTTELIKLLTQNEKGGISHKSREISLTINGEYMPNPQITLSSTDDGVCGPEIDLDVDGDFLKEGEQVPKTEWVPVSERLPEDGTWNIFTDGKKISIERYKTDALDHFYPSGRWFSLDEAVAWQPLPKPYSEVKE